MKRLLIAIPLLGLWLPAQGSETKFPVPDQEVISFIGSYELLKPLVRAPIPQQRKLLVTLVEFDKPGQYQELKQRMLEDFAIDIENAHGAYSLSGDNRQMEPEIGRAASELWQRYAGQSSLRRLTLNLPGNISFDGKAPKKVKPAVDELPCGESCLPHQKQVDILLGAGGVDNLRTGTGGVMRRVPLADWQNLGRPGLGISGGLIFTDHARSKDRGYKYFLLDSSVHEPPQPGDWKTYVHGQSARRGFYQFEFLGFDYQTPPKLGMVFEWGIRLAFLSHNSRPGGYFSKNHDVYSPVLCGNQVCYDWRTTDATQPLDLSGGGWTSGGISDEPGTKVGSRYMGLAGVPYFAVNIVGKGKSSGRGGFREDHGALRIEVGKTVAPGVKAWQLRAGPVISW